MAYQSYDVLRAMEQDVGLSIERLSVDGGASRNEFIMQFQADLLDIPVLQCETVEKMCIRDRAKLPQLEEDIKYMLIPSDPNDDKNTIVEIRSAAGGDEAAIFAGDLYKMYQRFCESRGWKTTVLDSSPSEAGGFKSIEFKVEGDRVYSVMKYESGVHRVQRVPKTESQGRIQTSTATVAVLPEAEERCV